MDRLHFLYSFINYCTLICYGIFNTLIILSEVNKNQVYENTYDFLWILDFMRIKVVVTTIHSRNFKCPGQSSFYINLV